jgi:DNA-binding NarL/FixJ family response regulator
MNTQPVRILLVEEHSIVRDSWKILLEEAAEFPLTIESSNSESAISQTREFKPDIILLGVSMQPTEGLELIPQLLNAIPSLRIIGLSVNNSPLFAQKMLSQGAKGYLTMTSSLKEIMLGIQEIINGREYVCDEIRANMGE